MDDKTGLGHEWITLQHNYERYEGHGLWIKLVAVVLAFAGMAVALEWWFVGLVLLVLWLQEGIFKTYQARLGDRLLEVEGLLRHNSAAPGPAYQLHAGWLARRKGAAGLIREYVASACRPTVAFPYAVLLLALVVVASRG